MVVTCGAALSRRTWQCRCTDCHRYRTDLREPVGRLVTTSPVVEVPASGLPWCYMVRMALTRALPPSCAPYGDILGHVRAYGKENRVFSSASLMVKPGSSSLTNSLTLGAPRVSKSANSVLPSFTKNPARGWSASSPMAMLGSPPWLATIALMLPWASNMPSPSSMCNTTLTVALPSASAKAGTPCSKHSFICSTPLESINLSLASPPCRHKSILELPLASIRDRHGSPFCKDNSPRNFPSPSTSRNAWAASTFCESFGDSPSDCVCSVWVAMEESCSWMLSSLSMISFSKDIVSVPPIKNCRRMTPNLLLYGSSAKTYKPIYHFATRFVAVLGLVSAVLPPRSCNRHTSVLW